MAYTRKDPSQLVIDLERIDEMGNGATFIHTSAPGLTSTEGPGATCETRWVFFPPCLNVLSQRSVSCLLSLSRIILTISRQFRIDELFLDKSTPEVAYRLETFRSTGSISATASQQLRCYFITKCNFPTKAPVVKTGERTDIKTVSDSAFLDRATKNTLDIYQEVISLLA